MSRYNFPNSVHKSAGAKSWLVSAAATLFMILVFTGCQTAGQRDMSNDLVPDTSSGYTTDIHDERYHTTAVTPELEVVVREDVTGYVNFTIWVTNKTAEPLPFPATLSTLSVRSREGRGASYLPMSAERYLEKVLRCYYETEGYEDFKNSVRNNYLKDSTIEPGKTVAGILRYEIHADRAESYSLRLPVGEKEVLFKYLMPRQ